MGVDGKVMSGDDKPGCLALDEDDSVGVVAVEPVFDVGFELGCILVGGLVFLCVG